MMRKGNCSAEWKGPVRVGECVFRVGPTPKTTHFGDMANDSKAFPVERPGSYCNNRKIVSAGPVSILEELTPVTKKLVHCEHTISASSMRSGHGGTRTIRRVWTFSATRQFAQLFPFGELFIRQTRVIDRAVIDGTRDERREGGDQQEWQGE